jgi:DinB superfamily
MPPQTPYTADLGDREPLTAMRDTVARIASLVSGWTPAQFERSYAPGKWSARQLLTHLAHTELALGNRARMALATPNYTAQAFDQDQWMAQESKLGGKEAMDALVACNAMNRALFASLTPAQRATSFSHPEYGALTVDWLIHQMAGHVLHHLPQIETIAAKQGG